MTYVWAADYVAAESYILVGESGISTTCFQSKAMWMFQTKNIIQTGLSIATSHDLNLKCSWVQEIHGNPLISRNFRLVKYIMILPDSNNLTLIFGNVRHVNGSSIFSISVTSNHLRFIALPESEALTSCILRCSATFSWCRFRGAELSAATWKAIEEATFFSESDAIDGSEILHQIDMVVYHMI